MGTPVVVVSSGGVAVVEAADGYGMPVMEVDHGYGMPVTVVSAYGLPVSFISDAARIVMSAYSVLESATIGTTVGALSVSGGSGTYTFTELADPDNKFAVSGTNLNTSAALNYETATLHSVTIQADNGVDDPITRVIPIIVVNVPEVTLAALTLSANTIMEGSPEGTVVGTINGFTSGSTLALTDDAGGRFRVAFLDVQAGSVPTDLDTASSHNITFRETHPDGANSPRDTVFTITVTVFVDFPELLLVDGSSFLLLTNGVDRLDIIEGIVEDPGFLLDGEGGDTLTDEDLNPLTAA